jgi:phage terminase large subunit GpA-like protein
MSDGWACLLEALAKGLAPDLELPIDEWADQHMVIPRDSGANEYGKYRTSRTPHAREVMRWLSPAHPCKRVVLKGASQMLKTQVALNFLGASIHQAPSNFLWIVPTGTLVKRASIRIDKTVREVDVLRERIATKRSRDALNNLTAKEFPGGTLHIVTAGAAANLSEVSARYVVFDEIDRSEDNVGSEGAPGALAEARQTTFESNRKTYYPSSPTVDGASPIDDLFKIGTQREALAECIHCEHLQPLQFERLIQSEDGTAALYPCIECGGIHEESDKTRMFARGAWSDGVPGDGETESATISQMFLPYGWLPWITLMRLYEKAKAAREQGNDNDMIVFYNTRLARCWAPDREAARYDQLMERAEPYKLRTVPAGAAVLTAAIDTQINRLELKVVGWGPGMEGWIVDYQVIWGSPAEPATWDAADQLLSGMYRHASGQMLGISCTFVDSGGNFTQEVYNFTSARRRKSIFAIKGASRPNRPIISAKPALVDITGPRGDVAKRGAQLWLIGTDTAKDYLAARWAKSEGPGAIHFSRDLDVGYYRQLTAEFRRTTWKRGHRVTIWDKKSGDANEAGDLMVYNVAAAHLLGLHKRSEYQWRAAFEKLVPPPEPAKPARLVVDGTKISGLSSMARFQRAGR